MEDIAVQGSRHVTLSLILLWLCYSHRAGQHIPEGRQRQPLVRGVCLPTLASGSHSGPVPWP